MLRKHAKINGLTHASLLSHTEIKGVKVSNMRDNNKYNR
jgi:hypothetical protein